MAAITTWAAGLKGVTEAEHAPLSHEIMHPTDKCVSVHTFAVPTQKSAVALLEGECDA